MTTTFEQEDRGAYYHGSAGGGYEYAWTQPGNVIRGNTFRHLGTPSISTTQWCVADASLTYRIDLVRIHGKAPSDARDINKQRWYYGN